MTKKTETMDLKGKPYAKVPTRIKLFREENVRGKIQTEHKYLDKGIVEFKAWIWRDKTDLIELMKSGVSDKSVLQDSSDSNGTAKGTPNGDKDFEKLETIAIGRALAQLGYLASGEVASFEEMENYYEEKEAKLAEAVFECTESIGNCESVDSLKAYWTSLSAELINNKTLIEAKNAKYKELISTKDVQHAN